MRQYRSVNQTAPPEKTPTALLAPGDLIRVRETDQGWRLAQVPKAQSALVSLDPKHGAIRALVGGMGFEKSDREMVVTVLRLFIPLTVSTTSSAGVES